MKVKLQDVVRELKRRNVRFALPDDPNMRYDEKERRHWVSALNNDMYYFTKEHNKKLNQYGSNYIQGFNEVIRALKTGDCKKAYKKTLELEKLMKELKKVVMPMDSYLGSLAVTIDGYAKTSKGIDVRK